MEGNVLDVFRVLALVVVWAIPAVLVLLVAIFAILSPVLIWAGVVSGLFRVIRDRVRRRVAAPRRRPVTTAAGVAQRVA